MAEEKEFSQFVKELEGEAKTVILNKLQRTGLSLDKLFDDLLKKHGDGLMCRLLGLSDRWSGSRWEIDHCNGRAGESIAGQFIKQNAAAAAERWLSTQIDTLPHLDPASVKRLREEYTEELRRQVRDQLRAKVTDEAAKIVNEIMANILGPGVKLKPQGDDDR